HVHRRDAGPIRDRSTEVSLEEISEIDDEPRGHRLVEPPLMEELLTQRLAPHLGASAPRQQDSRRIAGQDLEDEKVQGGDEEDGQDDVRGLSQEEPTEVHAWGLASRCRSIV